MPPLTADRGTPYREGDTLVLNVEAATLIYAGAIACKNAAGNAVPGSTALGLIALGRCEKRADNSTGAAGAIQVRVRPGELHFDNSLAGDLLTQADIGNDCFIVDDHSVAKTDGGGTRSRAGKVIEVDATGVWVAMGISKP